MECTRYSSWQSGTSLALFAFLFAQANEHKRTFCKTLVWMGIRTLFRGFGHAIVQSTGLHTPRGESEPLKGWNEGYLCNHAR